MPLVEKPEEIVDYLLETTEMEKLRQIASILHGGSDRERDLGHKLWLIINRAQPITGSIE